MGLICTASAVAIICLVAYLFLGAWHLVLISIIACTMGLMLKEEAEL